MIPQFFDVFPTNFRTKFKGYTNQLLKMLQGVKNFTDIALSVIPAGCHLSQRERQLRLFGKAVSNLQLFALQMRWLPLWGSWQSRRL